MGFGEKENRSVYSPGREIGSVDGPRVCLFLLVNPRLFIFVARAAEPRVMELAVGCAIALQMQIFLMGNTGGRLPKPPRFYVI
jgi:hypothetical protein